MIEEFKMIRAWGYTGFLEQAEKAWKEGFRPIFPHVITLVAEKERHGDYRDTKLGLLYTQQWAKTEKP